jgi:glutamyl-tRNA synthetase
MRVKTLQENTITAVFHSQEYETAKKLKAPLIHWLPRDMNSKCLVVLSDASSVEGFVEEPCKKLQAGTIVQFERFGFVRVDSNRDGLVTAYYCHR